MEQKPRRPVLTPPAKAKPDLTPPPVPRSISQKAGYKRSNTLLFLVFAVVAMGALGVVVILPRLVTRPTSTTPAKPETPRPETSVSKSTKTPELQAHAKVKAENLLRGVLEQQAGLENNGVKVWGEEKLATSYPAALAKVADGNVHLDAGRFELAAKSYSETLSLLNQLETNRPDRLQNALRKGMKSLEQLDDQAAQTQFEIALSLDPGNAAATHGLNRARNLKQVIERVQQGRAFELNADLAQAKKEYASAIALDGDYRPARGGLRRIDELILARKYKSAISTASAALERKEYEQSQQSLDRAASLRPNAPEVHNLGRKLREAKQFSALEEIRRSAAQHEEGERWEQALKAYDQALGIDQNATFAMLGKTRAEKYVRLDQQVDFYLTNPERLQSPDPLAQARKLLVVSNGMPNLGANLRAKLERLGTLVDDFSTPRPVVLRSDKLTDVTLYRIGRFGRFSERRMMLRPGEYTAVGSRTGYRDVRVRFRVPASGEETVITIRCEERI